MWIIPKNYPHWSACAVDMVESKEGLSELSDKLESSLMWRSKPTLLRTWLTRWKRVKWFRHLCGRMLKHSRQSSFEDALISSLPVIRANRSAQQEKEKGKKIPDTSGRTSGNTFRQLSLFTASSKTSKGISRLDSPLLSVTWKQMVMRQRGAYSQRLKSEHRTRGKESLSWLSPRTLEVDESYNNYRKRMKASGNPKNVGKKNASNLTMQAKMNWPSPTATDIRDGKSVRSLTLESAKHGSLRGISLNHATESKRVKEILQAEAKKRNWPTATARDWKESTSQEGLTRKDGKSRMDQLANAVVFGQQGRERSNTNGKSQEQSNWMTPDCSDRRSKNSKQQGLSNQVQSNWRTQAACDGDGGVKTLLSIEGDPAPKIKLRDPVNHVVSETSKKKLNPDWVEQLMGLPAGWTQLSGAGSGDNRIDRLRLLGNGVVPQTAEKAFKTLLEVK